MLERAQRARSLAALWKAAPVGVLLPILALGPLFGRHQPEPLRHVHDGTRSVAVEAVHGSLPAHFDAAGRQVERHCSFCLTQSRSQARTGPLGLAVDPPPSVALAAADSEGTPSLARAGCDLSRAPPRFL